MCACAIRSLPLAAKPLTTMYCHDSSYVGEYYIILLLSMIYETRLCIVPVYLDAPLWGVRWGRGQLAAEMMALCLELDATIMTSWKTDHDVLDRERKVTFEHRLPVRVANVLDKMTELLTTPKAEHDYHDDIEVCSCSERERER